MEHGTMPGSTALIELECRARHSGHTRTCQALNGGRSLLSLIHIADRGGRIADEALQQAVQIEPPPTLACKEGCDWCCHLTVGTTVPEVVRIVEYLRKHLSAEDLRTLHDRVLSLVQLRRQRTAAGRSETGLPCALLVNHRCTVYPVRPLMCGGFNSSDAAPCEQFVESGGQTHVPLYAPQLRLAALVLDGTIAGLSDCGLVAQRVELTAALRIALDEPDAIQRFLAGEPAFAAATLE